MKNCKFVKKCLIFVIFIQIFQLTINYSPAFPEEAKIINNLSDDNKQLVRKQLVDQIIANYSQNKIFIRISEYLAYKSIELEHPLNREPVDYLFKKTSDKLLFLFGIINPLIGRKTVDFYDTGRFMGKIINYLWLKDLCFLFLGIGEEHKEILTFFFLPQNNDLKQELKINIVKYLYPEVPEIPENKLWFLEMSVLIEKLGIIAVNISNN